MVLAVARLAVQLYDVRVRLRAQQVFRLRAQLALRPGGLLAEIDDLDGCLEARATRDGLVDGREAPLPIRRPSDQRSPPIVS